MRNIALRIEYDGADFIGSQWQKHGRSVQGALEDAWHELTREQRRVTLAGRTDAGVHARGQVANILTETHHDIRTIIRGLNGVLPDDVGVLAAWEATSDFHARHSAVRREYRYVIDNGRTPSPLLRRHAAYVQRRLDWAAMHTALQQVVGTHDFAPLSDGPQEGSTIRSCYSASCTDGDVWGQPLVVIDIAANAFLRHMVRNLVGTLIQVGEGRIDADGFAAVLAGANRRARLLAPAHGLYLMAVRYPANMIGAADNAASTIGVTEARIEV